MVCAGILWGICFLSACSGGPDAVTVREHYATLGSCSAHLAITENQPDTALSYELDYDYQRDAPDSFQFTAPESIAEIRGTVSGNSLAQYTLQFLDTMLDAPGEAKQISPATCWFVLLRQLCEQEPISSWSETASGQTFIALRYEMAPEASEVWLNAATLAPVYAEFYQNTERILTVSVSQFTEKE